MGDDRHREAGVEAAQIVPVSTDLGWLEPLYRQHSEEMFRVACRVTGNADDAEDVLQTVFLRLARRVKAPDLAGGAGAYLRRAAVNAALDVLRARRLRSVSAAGDAGARDIRDQARPIDEQQLDLELANQLRRALTRLNARSANMFVLRYFEGLGNRDIARAFGTSPSAVGVTLHRARCRLREEIGPYLGGTP
jgi:RNA polymerase sigma-70 factor (ECF subfamily)